MAKEKINPDLYDDGLVTCINQKNGKITRLTPRFTKTKNFKRLGWEIYSKPVAPPDGTPPHPVPDKKWVNMTSEERKLTKEWKDNQKK